MCSTSLTVSKDDLRLLLCEGRCNPFLRDLDEDILVLRRSSYGSAAGRMAPLYPQEGLTQRLRALLHTPHVLTGGDQARCEVCGAARRYGNTKSWSLGKESSVK